MDIINIFEHHEYRTRTDREQDKRIKDKYCSIFAGIIFLSCLAFYFVFISAMIIRYVHVSITASVCIVVAVLTVGSVLSTYYGKKYILTVKKLI